MRGVASQARDEDNDGRYDHGKQHDAQHEAPTGVKSGCCLFGQPRRRRPGKKPELLASDDSDDSEPPGMSREPTVLRCVTHDDLSSAREQLSLGP